jgi:uncharacterized Ntn-hydrolase superfamily protein
MLNVVYEKDGEKDEHVPFIYVSFEDPVTNKERKYKFKEFTLGEVAEMKVMKNTEKEDTVGFALYPIRFFINLMMVEGEKLDSKTPLHVFNYLKRELSPFLN